jgi:NADPH:quinone reductase-like Zn-dependent oxidoreductase
VSSAGIQIAKKFGANVIATAGTDEKLKRAQSLGADKGVNYKNMDMVGEVRKICRAVDIVFDHVGEQTWEANFKCIAWGGILVLCGASSGYDVKLDLRQVFYRQIQILGSTMGNKKDFPAILDGFEKGELRPVVDRTFALTELPKAHEYLESRAQFGKVVLEH